MTAGIPGTGITAMFYILLVLLMPLREMYLTFSKKSSWHRWANVLSLNAMVYLGAILIWTQGELLGLLLKPGTGGNVISVQPLKIALFTLLGVVLAVQLARAIRLMLTKPQALPLQATNLKADQKHQAPATRHIPDVVHTLASMPATAPAQLPLSMKKPIPMATEQKEQEELLAQVR